MSQGDTKIDRFEHYPSERDARSAAAQKCLELGFPPEPFGPEGPHENSQKRHYHLYNHGLSKEKDRATGKMIRVDYHFTFDK